MSEHLKVISGVLLAAGSYMVAITLILGLVVGAFQILGMVSK